ncbi:hypothetical protein IE81DRAFT_346806 [Ceraceosorus guamensis]|uniref:Uncharacterized protein n=1 Tax=Ceraceosorus guamensis TaxID=1522189 RepID=A0A316W3M2_9BASI|nr:hypothetical protein IE81DRAFT_346806 [Ceraceosorus guamensis]PWN43211.1 hypothetical protein IE81DRAFT_346806 [Ceraceosorus guamensis]
MRLSKPIAAAADVWFRTSLELYCQAELASLLWERFDQAAKQHFIDDANLNDCEPSDAEPAFALVVFQAKLAISEDVTTRMGVLGPLMNDEQHVGRSHQIRFNSELDSRKRLIYMHRIEACALLGPLSCLKGTVYLIQDIASEISRLRNKTTTRATLWKPALDLARSKVTVGVGSLRCASESRIAYDRLVKIQHLQLQLLVAKNELREASRKFETQKPKTWLENLVPRWKPWSYKWTRNTDLEKREYDHPHLQQAALHGPVTRLNPYLWHLVRRGSTPAVSRSLSQSLGRSGGSQSSTGSAILVGPSPLSSQLSESGSFLAPTGVKRKASDQPDAHQVAGPSGNSAPNKHTRTVQSTGLPLSSTNYMLSLRLGLAPASSDHSTNAPQTKTAAEEVEVTTRAGVTSTSSASVFSPREIVATTVPAPGSSPNDDVAFTDSGPVVSSNIGHATVSLGQEQKQWKRHDSQEE